MIQIKNRSTGAVILEGGFETVAELINKNPSADLRYADLCSADLSYADLSSANLRSADLSYANLISADLCSANLCSANLSSADLRYANLSSADLCYADLCSANLCYANLRYANLRSANLCYANLCYADLCSADLCSADLSSANLSSADLSSADLCYAKWDDLLVVNIWTIGPIGSRKSNLLVWLFSDGSYLYQTGCFSGSESKFVAAIKKSHGDSKHSTDYMAAITFIHSLIGWLCPES